MPHYSESPVKGRRHFLYYVVGSRFMKRRSVRTALKRCRFVVIWAQDRLICAWSFIPRSTRPESRRPSSSSPIGPLLYVHQLAVVLNSPCLPAIARAKIGLS